MFSHQLSLELLTRVFEHLEPTDPATSSVFLVCKPWRRAAFKTQSRWASHLSLNVDIPSLYTNVLPLIGDTCPITNVVLTSASNPEPFAWEPLGFAIDTRTLAIDPHLDMKLTVTLPSLLHRIRNLKLEVPSSSWHSLEGIFTNQDSTEKDRLSDMRSLALSRVFNGDGIDFLLPQAYTSPSLNHALRNANSASKLRSLHLYGCMVNLSTQFTLDNLQEFKLLNVPVAANLTPQAVADTLRCLPRLKRLEVSCVFPWSRGGLQPISAPVHLSSLESLSITGYIHHCLTLFSALIFQPHCAIQLIVTDLHLSAATNSTTFVDDHLNAIANHYKSKYGSINAQAAQIDVKKGICSLLATDTSTNASPSFFFGVLFEEGAIPKFVPTSATGIGRPINRFTVYDLLLKMMENVIVVRRGGPLEGLKLDIDFGFTEESFYQNPFAMARVKYSERGVQWIEMNYPQATEPLVWAAPLHAPQR